MASAPLQSAMSLFSTLLPQPSAFSFQQKPLPAAPSAPITIAQPPSKPNNISNDPPANAFTSLLGSSPPANPASNLCEVCMVSRCVFFRLNPSVLVLQYSFEAFRWHENPWFLLKALCSDSKEQKQRYFKSKAEQGPHCSRELRCILSFNCLWFNFD